MFWIKQHHKYRLKSLCHIWVSIWKSYKLIKSKADMTYTADPLPLCFSNYFFHQQRPPLCSFPVSSVTVDWYAILRGSHLQISFTVIVCKCQPPGTAAMFSVIENSLRVSHWKQGCSRRAEWGLYWPLMNTLNFLVYFYLFSSVPSCESDLGPQLRWIDELPSILETSYFISKQKMYSVLSLDFCEREYPLFFLSSHFLKHFY